MKTLDEVLEILKGRIDRPTLEKYIAREWLRPRSDQENRYFEEIDIARLELVCHLTQDININDDGMDVVLSLLDQLYGLRAHMHKLAEAVARQPTDVQTNIMLILNMNDAN